MISATKIITNVHLYKEDCVIFFWNSDFFPFVSFSVKKKNIYIKRGNYSISCGWEIVFCHASKGYSGIELLWIRLISGLSVTSCNTNFFPMTLLLKAFISSLWQKIDYYPWHLMDSFHKLTIFSIFSLFSSFFVFVCVCVHETVKFIYVGSVFWGGNKIKQQPLNPWHILLLLWKS